MRPSACSTRRSTSSTASGFFRSIPTEARLRFRRSQWLVSAAAGPFGGTGGRPLEADDLGAGVGQHHGGEGTGPDPRQLDDLDAAERSASRCLRHGRIVTRVPHWGQAGAMLIARAPGRVTLIGDHTDYNQGLSLPMAIDLATEATFTPRAGSFLIGVTSDQYPEPWEIPLGGDRPGATAGRTGGGPGRPGPTAARAAPCGSPAPFPVGAGLSSSAAFSVAVLLALGRAGDALELAKLCQSAEGAAGSRVGLLDPLAILGAQAGHALSIDFASLESHQVADPRGGGVRRRALRRRPPAGFLGLRRSSGRVRAGGQPASAGRSGCASSAT